MEIFSNCVLLLKLFLGGTFLILCQLCTVKKINITEKPFFITILHRYVYTCIKCSNSLKHLT